LKKIRTAVVAAILALTMGLQVVGHAATVPDEQFVITNPLTDDRYTGINLADTNFSVNSISMLEAFTADGTTRDSRILTRVQCQKIGDVGCESEKYFQYNALLGLCDLTTVTNCVSEVFATNSSGKRVVGKFVENFPGTTMYSYPGDPTVGLPTGASSFIVDFPEMPHLGGTTYLVVAYLQGARGFGQTKFEIENFNSAIFAVSKVAGSFSIPRPAMDTRPDHKLGGRQLTAGGFSSDQSVNRRSACVKTAPSECAVAWPMPLDVSFGYTLKMTEKIKGWLHGRLFDAQAEIISSTDGQQLLTVQGKPSLIPGIFAWFKKDAYPAPLKNYYATQSEVSVNTNGQGWPSNSGVSNGIDGLPYSIIKEAFGYDDGGFREVSAWIDAVGDKATYAQSVWSIRSMESQQYGNCMKGSDSLSGIVTTNSTMYIGSPPVFNQAEQTLDYKVMSPHYLPDGSEFKGSYDLLIKSDVARCVYGFSNAPISASVSIISSDGTSQVATTVVGERGGWLTLAAKGFTFSAPIVRVKLSQKAEPAPAKVDPAPAKVDPTPVAAPKVAAKKTTITCLKGKTVKKVTAVKPTCPTGFKKK
jgi:hypothetical protein